MDNEVTPDPVRKAFRVLRRNYGCPGNDGISIKDVKANYSSYAHRVRLAIHHNSYPFDDSPRRVSVLEQSGKERSFFVYNVVERWVQQCLRLRIGPVIDAILSDRVTAYRRGRTDRDGRAYILAGRPRFVLRLDITDYFCSISRSRLHDMLAELKIGFDLLCFVEGSIAHCSRGIPAGHVLAGALGNLYLHAFDAHFPVNYTRYSDDIMFACATTTEIDVIISRVGAMLAELGLSINQRKTAVVSRPTLDTLL